MSSPQPPTAPNKFLDPGNLMILDTSSLTSPSSPTLTESIILSHAKSNYALLQRHLYSLLSSQKGESNENRNYSKDENMVTLPNPILHLPRSNPIPTKKPLTKWEKFKKEKGIFQRKRSRMVYSDIAQDWVPRWGKGSAKKIEDEANWVMEDDGTGENPFDKRNAEKKLVMAKQEKRHIKNQLNAAKDNKGVNNNNNIVSNVPKRVNRMDKEDKDKEDKEGRRVGKSSKRERKFNKEINKLEMDKKNLGKRLEEVQKSTRSMGHFDKKLKNEKELNMIKKKKVSKDVLGSRKLERSRDKMIMDGILNKKK